MKLSVQTKYACTAIMELAAHYTPNGDGEPVCLRDIAERHSVPQLPLVQVLLRLKDAGIIARTRGASGGYYLKRSPEQITLDDVIRILEVPPDESA
jgi:Rrf2 family protein